MELFSRVNELVKNISVFQISTDIIYNRMFERLVMKFFFFFCCLIEFFKARVYHGL